MKAECIIQDETEIWFIFSYFQLLLMAIMKSMCVPPSRSMYV